MDTPQRFDPLWAIAVLIAVLVVVVAMFAAFTWKTPLLHRNVRGHPLLGTEATLEITLTGLSPATVTLARREVGFEVRNDTSVAHDLLMRIPVSSIAVVGSGDAGTDDVGDVVVHLAPHGDIHLAIFPRAAGNYSITCSGSPDGMEGTVSVVDPAVAPVPTPSTMQGSMAPARTGSESVTSRAAVKHRVQPSGVGHLARTVPAAAGDMGSV